MGQQGSGTDGKVARRLLICSFPSQSEERLAFLVSTRHYSGSQISDPSAVSLAGLYHPAWVSPISGRSQVPVAVFPQSVAWCWAEDANQLSCMFCAWGNRPKANAVDGRAHSPSVLGTLISSVLLGVLLGVLPEWALPSLIANRSWAKVSKALLFRLMIPSSFWLKQPWWLLLTPQPGHWKQLPSQGWSCAEHSALPSAWSLIVIGPS